MIRGSRSLSSLPMIVHKFPSYRRRDMQTTSLPQTSGPIWTCSVKCSRYGQYLLIACSLLLTSSISTLLSLNSSSLLKAFLQCPTCSWQLSSYFLRWKLRCYGLSQKTLDSAVMTTWAESRISHGLLEKQFLVQALMWCLSYCSCISHAHGHQSS
jgi:hypothetical protein